MALRFLGTLRYPDVVSAASIAPGREYDPAVIDSSYFLGGFCFVAFLIAATHSLGGLKRSAAFAYLQYGILGVSMLFLFGTGAQRFLNGFLDSSEIVEKRVEVIEKREAPRGAKVVMVRDLADPSSPLYVALDLEKSAWESLNRGAFLSLRVGKGYFGEPWLKSHAPAREISGAPSTAEPR